MTRPPAVRLEDVAQAAGVHVSTVSRVLTGNDKISVRAETRRRIEDTARGLGYRPNAQARGLKLASTGALGLLVPSLRNPVYSVIIRSAVDRAWQRGHVVLLVEDIDEQRATLAYDRLVAERRIDGALIASARPEMATERFIDGAVPCVFVNRRVPESPSNVSMREREAGELAAEHLLSLGHTRLGHVGGPAGLDTSSRRTAGFVERCRRAGHPPIVVHSEFDERAGYDATSGLLSRAERPTGIFVGNFAIAIGALAAVRGLGCRVPQDVSVIACDDDPSGAFLEAPLTTIQMPMDALGRTAVDALVDQIEGGPPTNVTIDIDPKLIVRASTAPV